MALVLGVPTGRRKPSRMDDETAVASTDADERVELDSSVTPADSEVPFLAEPDSSPEPLPLASTDAASGLGSEPAPGVEPTVVKTRRGKGRGRKAKGAASPTAAADSTAATWVRIGPGKFVRADSVAHDPAAPVSELSPPAPSAESAGSADDLGLDVVENETTIGTAAVEDEPAVETPCVFPEPEPGVNFETVEAEAVVAECPDAPSASFDDDAVQETPDVLPCEEPRELRSTDPEPVAAAWSEPAQDEGTPTPETEPAWSTTWTVEPTPAVEPGVEHVEGYGPVCGDGEENGFGPGHAVGFAPDDSGCSPTWDNGIAPDALVDFTPDVSAESDTPRPIDLEADPALPQLAGPCDAPDAFWSDPLDVESSPPEFDTTSFPVSSTASASDGENGSEPRSLPTVSAVRTPRPVFRIASALPRRGSRRQNLARVGTAGFSRAGSTPAAGNVHGRPSPRISGIRRSSCRLRHPLRSLRADRTHPPRSPPTARPDAGR